MKLAWILWRGGQTGLVYLILKNNGAMRAGRSRLCNSGAISIISGPTFDHDSGYALPKFETRYFVSSQCANGGGGDLSELVNVCKTQIAECALEGIETHRREAEGARETLG